METYKGKINEFVEWVGGKDIITENNVTDGLDVSGGSIRNLLLEHLRKPFYSYEDKEYGLYRMFSSQDAFNIWYSDRENNSDLELFNFVRPSDYEIETDLTADPRYIMSGNADSIDARIIYHWDVKNSSGSYADSISATYTVTTQDNKINAFSEIYNSTLKDVNVNIYKYLDYGQNTVNVRLRATSTGAAASISFVVTVIKLDINSTFGFNEKHIYGEPLNIPITLTRNDASRSCSIYVYIDEQLVKKIDIPTNSSLVYLNTVSDILNTYEPSTVLNPQVIHTLQIYAQTEYNGVVFRSNIIYYTFETASSDSIANYFINIADSFESGIPPIIDFVINATQYEPVTVKWGYYTDLLQNNTSIPVSWKLSINGVETDIATITANSGRQSQDLTFIPNEYSTENTYLVAYYNDRLLTQIPMVISQSALNVYETPLYSFKLSAYGKTNSSTDKNIWVPTNDLGQTNSYNILFNGVEWNDNSGWYKNSLRLSGSNQYVTINTDPFTTPSGASTQPKTIEFEFESEKIADTDDVILTIGNANGARIEVTPNKATLFDNNSVDRIHTNYKAGERIKLAFIINTQTETADSNLIYIVNNGILERGSRREGDFTTGSGNIKIGASNSGIRLYSIRIYNRAIDYTDAYNNYVFDSDNKSEIISNNNVIDQNSRLLDYNLCSNKIDTILISGNLNRILDSLMGKDESLTDVTIERFCPFDTTKNFRCENCQIRKHGQSTLNYPISSMKIWFNKNTQGGTPIFTCEAQAPLGLGKNRYKMKDSSIPANKFILQANYADSSGVHNGGLQRLIQNTWYNAVIDGEYKLRTEPLLFTTNQTVTHNSTELNEDGTVDGLGVNNKQWGDYFDKSFPYNIRIAPDSTPCVVFYKNVEGDNRNTFLGQYVLMEDKKSDFNFGERSIYKAASNDPFCLTVAHKNDDKNANKIWDNDGVLRMEVLNINNNFTSFMSMTDTLGINFESIVNDNNDNPSHYRWELDFEMIYPDPDDLLGDQSAGTDKFGANSKFLSKAEPFINWFKWLVGTYNNEQAFIETAAQHLDLYKMAAYYIFVLRCALTDSFERNAQIKTYDGTHFHYEPWDMDIAFGNKNTGGIAFDPPVSRNTKLPGSVSTYAFSGRSADNNGNIVTSNWLWDALEAWPYWMDVVVPKVAQALYMAGLNYDNMTKMFDDEYANKWCEIIYNESGYFKYVEAIVGEPKLEWLQGARKGHRHWWMSTSMDYYDAKWSVGDFRTHNIYIAANHTQNVGGNDIIQIIPTSPTYVALIQNDTLINIAGSTNPQYTDKYNPASFDISSLTLQYKVPFYVRGASYIENIDLSCLSNELDIVRFGSAYSEVSGAPLKSVNLGCPTTISGTSATGSVNAFDLNLSILSDGGNNSFENLETLNLRGQKERLFGFSNVRDLDLSRLKNVYAMGGQYTSFYSSNSGNNFVNLELPGKTINDQDELVSAFTTLDLNNSTFSNLTFWDCVLHDNNTTSMTKVVVPSTLTTVRFTGTTCQSPESKLFVLDWIDTIVTNEGENGIGTKTLRLENVNWATAPYMTYQLLSRLAKFNGGNNKPQDNTMSGYIVLSNETQLTSEELTLIRTWFGESVFNKNSSGLVIDQQLNYMRINIGADATLENGLVYLREGKRASLNATKFSLSEDSTDYTWFIRQPGTNVTSQYYKATSLIRGNDGIWYIKADESNLGTYDVEIVCTGGIETTTATITIVGTTYPQSYTFNTKDTIDSQGTFNGKFRKEGVGVEMYITPSNTFTGSILDVTFSLVRNNDNRELLSDVSYTTFKNGDATTTPIDLYLRYRATSDEEYGIVIMSSSVPLNDDIYTYTLTANVIFRSGVSREANYTFLLLNDSVIILVNDASPIYSCILASYTSQIGSAPANGLFYRSELLDLASGVDIGEYSDITSLRTQTNKSIFDYLQNVLAVILSDCSDLPSIDLNIAANGGNQIVFNKMPNLSILRVDNCTSFTEDIDLSLNTNITEVDASGTNISIILPEHASITKYKLGTPGSINIINPIAFSVISNSFNVLNSTSISSIDIVNIPQNKTFTTLMIALRNGEPTGMTHIYVELANIQESVNSNTIVETLYNISKREVNGASALDNTSDISGSFIVDYAYLDAIDYLNNKYDNLTVSARNHLIRFANPDVATICRLNWGSSYGLTTELASTHTTISMSSGNFATTGIDDISWLRYFTGATRMSADLFADCTNITQLVFPPNITHFNDGSTSGNPETGGFTGTFLRCNGLVDVVIPEGVIAIGLCAFCWCDSIETIDLPSTLTQIQRQAFNVHSLRNKTKYIICRATTPPTLQDQNALGWRGGSCPIYVPDSSLSDYLSSSWGSMYSTVLKPLSEFEQDKITNNW